jgi:alanine racemase
MDIDLQALAMNYREVERLVGPDIKIIASVKGNGYGMGVAQVARVLQRLGVYAVATGSYKDGMAIRKAGLDVKVQMFPGNLSIGIAELLRHDLIPSVYNMDTAKQVSQVATRPSSVFIKVDCGLARLGIPVEEAEAFIREVASLPNVVVEGVYTHLPFNDTNGLEWVRPRLARFDELVIALRRAGMEIPVTQSIASSGVVCGLATECNTVCVGHLLFGGLGRVTPDLSSLTQFRPVLKAVKSHLIHVEHHETEKAVGTGGSYNLRAGSKTAVVPVGLHDGYRGAVRGQTAMMIVHGQRVPVLYVSQEYTTLDVSRLSDPKVEDAVTILGVNGAESISIEELAQWFGGMPLNVLMDFNERYAYRYLDGAAE